MRPRMRASVFVVVVAASGAVGCGPKVQARTAPERPPLEVPPPPPRVITPSPIEEAPLQETAPPEAAAAPAGKPSGARPHVSRPGKPKTDPKTAAPEKPETEARPADSGVTLRTPSASDADLEKKIRGLLSTARADLNRVDYRNLKPDAKVQYDTARRFAEQAEAALKDRNVAFALKLAEKAAELAAGLGREIGTGTCEGLNP